MRVVFKKLSLVLVVVGSLYSVDVVSLSHRAEQGILSDVMAKEEMVYQGNSLIERGIVVYDASGFISYEVKKKFSKKFPQGINYYRIGHLGKNKSHMDQPPYYLLTQSVGGYETRVYEYQGAAIRREIVFQTSQKVDETLYLSKGEQEEIRLKPMLENYNALIYHYNAKGRPTAIETGTWDKKSGQESPQIKIALKESISYDESRPGTTVEEHRSQWVDGRKQTPPPVIKMVTAKQGDKLKIQMYRDEHLVSEVTETLDNRGMIIETLDNNGFQTKERYFYRGEYSSTDIQEHVKQNGYLDGLASGMDFLKTLNHSKMIVSSIENPELEGSDQSVTF